jgi:hypothetical protein
MEEAEVASAAGIQGFPSCLADAEAKNPYGLAWVYLDWLCEDSFGNRETEETCMANGDRG